MADMIRWGLLSTARINRSLIGPIRRAGRSELVAVGSRSEPSARAYSAEHDIPRAWGSYQELVADPEVDVVYVSLPNSLHCEWTVRAAEAGKHVLCEKPLVLSLEELARVEAAAQANGVQVVEAFMYLHHPQTRWLRETVHSGGLGELQTIHSWFGFPLRRSDDYRWRPEMGGGSLWDVGVYPNSLSIVMAGAGAPREVWATQRLGETGVDLVFDAQMRFANRVTAHISSGFRQPRRWGALLMGSESVVEVAEPWHPGETGSDSEVTITTLEGGTSRHLTSAMSPYLAQVEAMEASILEGAAPVVGLADSRLFLRTILALKESAVSGRPVTLS